MIIETILTFLLICILLIILFLPQILMIAIIIYCLVQFSKCKY